MRRILSLILVLTIALALSVPALADDPLPYTDVEGHWALRYIEQVTASGLMKGDIIVEFSGKPVTCADDLNAIKAEHTSGDVVPVKIDRNGRELTLDIVLPQPTDVETLETP